MTPVVPRTCDVCARAGRDRRTPPGKRHLHELEIGARFRTSNGITGTVAGTAPGRIRVEGTKFDTFSPTTTVTRIEGER